MTVVNLPKELLDFYEGLEVILANYSAKITLPELEMTEELLKQHYQEGIPFFKLMPVKFDRELCREIFKEISFIMEEKRAQTTPQVKAFQDVAEHVVDSLVMDYINGEEKNIERTVKGNRLSRITVEFMLEYTAKPFMKAYSKLVGSFNNDEDWHKNYCPVCGNKARYARISGEDNKRFLHCSLCDHQWLYKRMACHSCTNEDHNSLRTIFIEETPAHQIHVCDQCKTYLKVFDSRQGSVDKANLKDAQTVFLDIIAQQKGYISICFSS